MCSSVGCELPKKKKSQGFVQVFILSIQVDQSAFEV